MPVVQVGCREQQMLLGLCAMDVVQLKCGAVHMSLVLHAMPAVQVGCRAVQMLLGLCAMNAVEA